MKKTNVTTENVPVYRNYKDRVFRLLYSDSVRLLELYNALNGSDYTDVDALTITTLENAIYMKMKNDVSYMIESNLYLYEHQSSYCPNMPLRGFLYFADLYKTLLKGMELSSNKRIKIPTPHYIVFYNGTEWHEEEFVQRLSDSFETDEEGCIDLVVKSINVNQGYNKQLLEKCPSLYGYSYFVSVIRENKEKKGMELEEAIKEAVEECIEKGILKDFLMEQKAEVIAMSIYEFNEESARKLNYEAGEEVGYARGEEVGYARGEERVNRLYAILIEKGRVEDAARATKDSAYRQELFEEFGI